MEASTSLSSLDSLLFEINDNQSSVQRRKSTSEMPGMNFWSKFEDVIDFQKPLQNDMGLLEPSPLRSPLRYNSHDNLFETVTPNAKRVSHRKGDHNFDWIFQQDSMN